MHEFNISNNLLKTKISNFKNLINSKDYPIVYEQNNFDIFLNIVTDYSKKFYFKFLQTLATKIINMVKNSFNNFLDLISNVNKFEKKIEHQEKIINQTFEINNNLSRQINELSQKFNNYVSNAEKVISTKEKINVKSVNVINNKERFYQEENLRLSNELHETKTKFEIIKKEIEKFQNQRSDLINKINSINDVVEDSNIVTSVFNNNYDKDKIKIVDSSKNNKIKIQDLNKEIKNIFAKK